MYTDFVLNGQGVGEFAQALGHVHFDPGLLRPYIETNPNSPLRGQRVASILTGRMVFNNQTREHVPERKKFTVRALQERGINSPAFVTNSAMMRKEDWQFLDRAVQAELLLRLRMWADLEAANPVGGFDAMSKLTYEYEAESDFGEAVVDMDLMSPGRTDAPMYLLRSLPLPITHADFFYSSRRIAVSRNSGTPLNDSAVRAGTRRCAEKVEKTLAGTIDGLTYGTVSTGPTQHSGTSTVYGYGTYPDRVVKNDLTTPTGSNPEAIMTDVLEMVDLLAADGFSGPFILYHSPAYSRYLSDDYFRTGSTSAVRSVRARLLETENLQDIRRAEYLGTGFRMQLVQMTPDVAQAINGMDFVPMMWEDKGGARTNIRVAGIKVPLVRSTYAGKAGIVDATTS